jgi:Zn-finger protein
MNRFLLAICLMTAVALPAAVWAQAPGTGIENSAHDFRAQAALDGNTVGVCTFCHTPHRAQSTRLVWNHTLSSETYEWLDIDSTTGGTPLPTFDSSWQGVSKNCLSCHDGTVAIGDVAWFNAAAATGIDALSDHQHDDPNDPGKITFASANDGDLSGNHPVAVPFPFGSTPNVYNGATNGTQAAASGWQADPEAAGIRLFNDDGAGQVTAGSVAGRTGIECSSCHDPHNGAQVEDVYFLRGLLTGGAADGYICLKCHDK